MRLIIAGCRTIEWNYLDTLIDESINYINDTTKDLSNMEIISGGAYGADSMGEAFAHRFNLPLKKFPADWDKYGKRAGFIRNHQMGDYATHLIAFWDGKSRGTKDMINYMKSLEKEVKIIYIK